MAAKIGCMRCGKEWGTNPECPCWNPKRNKEVQMRQGTWFTERWYKTCMKCDLAIGEEDASYCPNCGKWLGSIRGHVIAFFLLAAVAFVVAIGMAIIVYVNGGALVHSILATVFGGLCLGLLSAIKPFGSYLVSLEEKQRRAEEWNAEVERRRMAEEDLEERERSASEKARSEIVVNFEMKTTPLIDELKKAQKMITGVLKKSKPSRKEFPLFDSIDSSFVGNRMGMIILEQPSRLSKCIKAGAQLLLFRRENGQLESFHLEPIYPTNEDAFDKNKLDPAFNIRDSLPVRNGPRLQIAFIDGKESRESLEDIKRNLLDVYEWKSRGRKGHHGLLVHEIVEAWAKLKNPGEENACEKGPIKGCEVCCGTDERMLCARIYLAKKDLMPDQITFTTISKGLDKFTDIQCSCGRKSRASHQRSEFICPCGRRYVNTSRGWRPEPRCRLQFGSEMCVGRPCEIAPGDHCNKTLECCRAHRNEERFAP